MKKFVIIFSIFLSACSSTDYLTLRVPRPPIVATPENARNIGLVDRTTASGDGIFNKLEEILSAEAFSIDEEATSEILDGFGSTVTAKTKFRNAKMISLSNTDKSIANFLPKLSWSQVEKLASTENVDIIVELSFFDTDSDIDYRSTDRQVEVPILGKKTVKNHIASVTTNYRCGWRIYLPEDRVILDEFVFESFFSVEGEGINPITAVQEILNQRNILLKNCRLIGEQYATRLLPTNFRERRRYFVRGHEKFELAKRYAQAGDWDQAGEIWKDLSSSSDEKIAGRACYNMAIISEINGDIIEALEWAKKAYAVYEIDLALEYIDILETQLPN